MFAVCVWLGDLNTNAGFSQMRVFHNRGGSGFQSSNSGWTVG